MKRRIGKADHVAVEADWRKLARRSGFRASGLAKMVGVSLRTLQRHFRACYGLTVTDWLKRVRMEEANARIRAGQRVKQVAFELGYKQLSHFSREFKRTYGRVPTKTEVPKALKEEIAAHRDTASGHILNSGPR